ncbi:glycerol-3-phosphate dehydrogenase/oxidase [Lichenihabitans sp. Uapishka_5]|uniref:glycerol-3-phosphate dehydrogenase/oxidase n=1 Tax=Lichenihabitans sp. Uapishka_5 TaxID=3037302 RepID=UPI0029E81414|nr:glycerol-3-phosphate dehydrogenase/oxidase [Lichenihabitans sp. Uapishka_5]MDX7952104.1 glycerol-3-phosphate dehydrogenase/oxidase [Lichenihabitans sp. Uapishka_5]
MTAPETADPARTPAAHYPVVIVGGGINGAGLFRDLCLQGVDCLLCEADDFCAGASAGPSRLIHGGIKYLETGEFRLVAQSTLERNLLLKNAPHYVTPIETVLPIPSWFGGILPSAIRFFGGKAKLKDRGVLITKLGLEMFDFFGRHHRGMPRHSVTLRDATRKTFPDIATWVAGTATYYDARITHAERLGLELLLDGMAAQPGSRALNHMAVSGQTDGALAFTDRITGAVHRVTADVVVNAAGAWIDKAGAALGLATRYIGGNKGSHLVVDNPRLLAALDGKMIYFGASDGRVALLYPFMGKVLIGSTDIPVSDADEVFCSDEERDYMLGTVREVFPGIPLDAAQVIYTYCGVRPLPRAEGLDPGAVSRDHSIRTDTLPGSAVPVHALIGGKWTTFRGFAAEAADRVLKDLGRARRRSTELEPIGGGRDFPKTEAERRALLVRLTGIGVSEPRAKTLLGRYGTRALAVAEWCVLRQDTPLATLPDYGRAELGFILAHEQVGRLADLLFRRTDIALSGRLTPAVTEEAAGIAREALGWSEERCRDEEARVARTAATRHGLAARFDTAVPHGAAEPARQHASP